MFFVLIKLRHSNFSSYLILIVFLTPKKLFIILVPAKTNFV